MAFLREIIISKIPNEPQKSTKALHLAKGGSSRTAITNVVKPDPNLIGQVWNSETTAMIDQLFIPPEMPSMVPTSSMTQHTNL